MPYDGQTVPGRILDGDPAAVAQVTRWIAQALASPRYWILRPEWEDLHQESLLATLESLRSERFDASRELRTYVQGIVHHAASKRMTRFIREQRGTRLVEDSPDPAPSLDGKVDLARFARSVLDQLSPSCRDLIKHYFFEELSYDEISSRSGLPIGTVKSRLARCLTSARTIVRAREPQGVESE
jgi:RNA polymerase sigma-70 factor (ECF subfamily)